MSGGGMLGSVNKGGRRLYARFCVAIIDCC